MAIYGLLGVNWASILTRTSTYPKNKENVIANMSERNVLWYKLDKC